MQFAENLTDRQAADAVRARIDWKYALSLELEDPGFDFSLAQYAARSGIEGTLSQAVFALGMRRSRYRGQAKTHVQQVMTAAAINLKRIIDWIDEVPRSQTYRSAFAQLAAA